MTSPDKLEIARLDGELAKARADVAWLSAVHSSVNNALNRAGIFCAVTFPEAIDQIARERDAAVRQSDRLAAARDTATAEVSRLKAGLVGLRSCLDPLTEALKIEAIDALIGKETSNG